MRIQIKTNIFIIVPKNNMLCITWILRIFNASDSLEINKSLTSLNFVHLSMWMMTLNDLLLILFIFYSLCMIYSKLLSTVIHVIM